MGRLLIKMQRASQAEAIGREGGVKVCGRTQHMTPAFVPPAQTHLLCLHSQILHFPLQTCS